jgi:hypothetical protein
MSGTPTPKSSVGNALKIYFFPSLVTVLAMLIWRDVSELRSDVKSLLAQSNVDKTEIINLKKDVDILNHQIFKTPISPITYIYNDENTDRSMIAASHDKYFKHEEVFDIDRYLPKS